MSAKPTTKNSIASMIEELVIILEGAQQKRLVSCESGLHGLIVEYVSHDGSTRVQCMISVPCFGGSGKNGSPDVQSRAASVRRVETL